MFYVWPFEGPFGARPLTKVFGCGSFRRIWLLVSGVTNPLGFAGQRRPTILNLSIGDLFPRSSCLPRFKRNSDYHYGSKKRNFKFPSRSLNVFKNFFPLQKFAFLLVSYPHEVECNHWLWSSTTEAGVWRPVRVLCHYFFFDFYLLHLLSNLMMLASVSSYNNWKSLTKTGLEDESRLIGLFDLL